MADLIGIVGDSGTGKSTSIGKSDELGIEGLDPATTAILNVVGKNLPFRGGNKLYPRDKKISEGGNYFESSIAGEIADAITLISTKRPDIKVIVIDDGQYIMAYQFMSKALEEGYKKFAVIGADFSKVIKTATNARKDLKVFFLWHPEKSDTGVPKMKTVGKMVDDYLTLEGLFSVILYTKVIKKGNDISYTFVTNRDGSLPAKSPRGMFPTLEIPNDLGKVVKAIDAYNDGE
jgi:hypothetical protein